MKRFIITSVCALVLSLFGAFGTNLNSLNAEAQTNTVNSTTQVVQNVTNKECKEIAAKKLSTKKATKKKVAKKKGAKKSPALVYKNVDLSQCDSVKDVVSMLQKNGYTNITKSNIQNINSLDDILAYIQKNGASNNNTNTTCTTKATPTTVPAPTTKPAPTTVPAPTTKPAPSTAPAPTTKPAPTTAPVPTTKPTPTTAPTPTTKPSTSTNTSGISNYANQVLQLVNKERAKAGLSALTTNATITSAANKRAQETVQSFSHTRPNGSGFSTVLQEYGVPFRAAGENIAYGQKTPQEVVTGWMNSPGHRANILNTSFGKIGIGVYQTNGVIYWSQLFTN